MRMLLLGLCDEPPRQDEIMDLALQAIICDKDEACYAPVVTHLIKAWAELITFTFYEEHGREMKIRWVKGAVAERVYNKAYKTVNPSEDDSWWPDALPYDEELPAEFVKIVAQGLARKDLATQKAFFEYMKKTEGQDATTD